MLRYIIATGNPENARDCEVIRAIRSQLHETSGDWRFPIELPTFHAAYLREGPSSASAISLANDRGIIFGSLFQSPATPNEGEPQPIRSIRHDEEDNILRSKGRSMIRDYWGYYIAALLYPKTSTVAVMRSPVSMLACFHARLGSLSVFFSDLDDYVELALSPLLINWDMIAAQVAGGDYLTSETAIEDLSAVECGECVTWRPEQCLTDIYWDPRSFLESQPLRGFAEATQAIRDISDYCASAHSPLAYTYLDEALWGIGFVNCFELAQPVTVQATFDRRKLLFRGERRRATLCPMHDPGRPL